MLIEAFSVFGGFFLGSWLATHGASMSAGASGSAGGERRGETRHGAGVTQRHAAAVRLRWDRTMRYYYFYINFLYGYFSGLSV